MTETIFGELVRDWRRATGRLHHHEATMTANPADPAPEGAPQMSLTDVVAAFRTDLEAGEAKIRTVLDQHVPGLVALAEKVENDPLIQAAEAAALPPGAKQLVADFITRLADTFPQQPVTEPPVTEPPADPAPVTAPSGGAVTA